MTAAPITSNVQTQIKKGRDAMIIFHNRALKYNAYHLTLDQLISTVGGYKPEIFLESMGFNIEITEATASQIRDAMESLADKGGGLLPANKSMWFQALSNRIQNYTFMEAAKFTTQESAQKLAEGAKEVGDTVISTLKSLGIVAPILIIGGLIFYVYRKVKHA